MALLDKSQRLKKQLGLWSVYAIATGTTLSSGLFLLPGLATASAGPAVVLSYIIAVIPLVPATMCVFELATAMPRAGGVYYFLDRSMGPWVGTVGGVGTWLALILKTSFALVGMGAYLGLFLPDLSMTWVAVGLALFFGVLNVVGAKATGWVQTLLVGGLLGILGWFVGDGLGELNPVHFDNFWGRGNDAILATSAMVYISYVGVTKVASISEEVLQPERNLPRGGFLAVGTAVVVYGLGVLVMVGLVPPEILVADVTPMATAARFFGGHTGVVVISVAALLAFSSVANAGILSASRYPLAMSRDALFPHWLGRLSGGGIPRLSVVATVGLILVCVTALDPARIAKLASAFQLLMFMMVCAAVMVMRESRIASYDPGYRVPWYPWVPLFGLVSSGWLLSYMGWLPLLFTAGLVGLSLAWFRVYGQSRVHRQGAIFHIFEHWGQRRYGALDTELRAILKEKGIRRNDPYESVVTRAQFIDAPRGATYEAILAEVSVALARHLPESEGWIRQQLVAGTPIGATPVELGIALPHFRHGSLAHPCMVIVRSQEGIQLTLPGDEGDEDPRVREHLVHALFCLVSPEHDPALHLRILAQIASHVEENDFMTQWQMVQGEHAIKELLLHDDRILVLELGDAAPLSGWVGQRVRDLAMPDGCLIAMIARGGEMLIPRGGTCLELGDRLTVIGEPRVIRALTKTHHRRELALAQRDGDGVNGAPRRSPRQAG